MPTTNYDDLVFEVTRHETSEHFKECWDTYYIFVAQTVYKEVIYKAWGTEPAEAKKKAIDLIAQDKRNGTHREPGQVVE